MATVTLQNVTTKTRIFTGDTFNIIEEHRIPDPTANPANMNRGVPGSVQTATVQVWSLQAGTYLALGGTGVTVVPATITPKTSTVGALIEYTVPSSFTQNTGDYSLFLTLTFDGEVKTIRYRYKVLAKR